MSQPQQHSVGTVHSQTYVIDYVADPLSSYFDVTHDTAHTLLLESAEIDSKDNLKSIMLLDACVRFECIGLTVTAQALNVNGTQVLNMLNVVLASYLAQKTNDTSTYTFTLPDSQADEDTRLKFRGVFDVLRTCIEQFKHDVNQPLSVFLGGCFAYDLLGTVENLPAVPDGANTCPDFVFYLGQTLCVIDHKAKSTSLISNLFTFTPHTEDHVSPADTIQDKINSNNASLALFEEQQTQRIAQLTEQLLTPPTKLTEQKKLINSTVLEASVNVDKSDEEYCNDVDFLKEHILAGDIFQVVPSRTFSLPCQSPILAYQHLKQLNPSPYMFFMQDFDFALFGASPESALKYTALTNQVEIYPIAGTRPRGKRNDGSIDHDLDSRIELNLREDLKEKSEHIMLVDLARNDVARVSIPGTRHVKELLKVDRYSHVMHLVSRVVGQLREDLDALHAYQACLNMGTLVGAPKVSAATLIRQVEKQRRGSYGGAVGYLDGQGNMDSCIVIRSAFVKNNMAHIQAGAGVVYDSVPQSEADETRAKAQAVIKAVLLSQQEPCK